MSSGRAFKVEPMETRGLQSAPSLSWWRWSGDTVTSSNTAAIPPVSPISASSAAKIPFDPVLPDPRCSREQIRMDQEGK